MKAVFADTSFFLASLNPEDETHGQAITLSRQVTVSRVTTAFVLLEVANAMCRSSQRAHFVEFLSQLREHPQVRIIPASQELFDQGAELYAQRKDKDWSLTDCISFVVMKDAGLSEALTADHHFVQAGFKALLS